MIDVESPPSRRGASVLPAKSPRSGPNVNTVSVASDTTLPSIQQLSNTPIAGSTYSPHSPRSGSTVFGVELAPLRWYSLLAGDAAAGPHNDSSTYHPSAGHHAYHLNSNVTTSRQLQDHPSAQSLPTLLNPSSGSSRSVNEVILERQRWQVAQPIQLKEREHEIFNRFVTGVSPSLDLFDPDHHFSTYVPHLAMYNGS